MTEVYIRLDVVSNVTKLLKVVGVAPMFPFILEMVIKNNFERKFVGFSNSLRFSARTVLERGKCRSNIWHETTIGTGNKDWVVIGRNKFNLSITLQIQARHTKFSIIE